MHVRSLGSPATDCGPSCPQSCNHAATQRVNVGHRGLPFSRSRVGVQRPNPGRPPRHLPQALHHSDDPAPLERQEQAPTSSEVALQDSRSNRSLHVSRSAAKDRGKLCRFVGFACGLILSNPSTEPREVLIKSDPTDGSLSTDTAVQSRSGAQWPECFPARRG